MSERNNDNGQIFLKLNINFFGEQKRNNKKIANIVEKFRYFNGQTKTANLFWYIY